MDAGLLKIPKVYTEFLKRPYYYSNSSAVMIRKTAQWLTDTRKYLDHSGAIA